MLNAAARIWTEGHDLDLNAIARLWTWSDEDAPAAAGSTTPHTPAKTLVA